MKTETRLRSFVKAVVWRLFGLIILSIISYLYLGNWHESLSISIMFNIVRFILYYVHERIWNRIQWGVK